jgi:predicted phosphodiesterase
VTRFAVLADIHGNILALEAVVRDAARRGIESVVNLGDNASGPLWPDETVSFLIQQNWQQIAGNCDRALLQQSPETLGASDRYAFDRLSDVQKAWLAGLPARAAVFDGVLAVHGTPSSDSEYLLESINAGQVDLAEPSVIEARLGEARSAVVLCGHSHLPRIVRVRGTLIVNPGSVGLPAYTHDSPEPHAMETGAPDARYAVLERTTGGWCAELVAVPYDHEMAARQARLQNRHDWVSALETGWVTM